VAAALAVLKFLPLGLYAPIHHYLSVEKEPMVVTVQHTLLGYGDKQVLAFARRCDGWRPGGGRQVKALLQTVLELTDC